MLERESAYSRNPEYMNPNNFQKRGTAQKEEHLLGNNRCHV